MSEELKPCPFCGLNIVELVLTDGEGNLRPPEYEDDPWSGLGFFLYHPETEEQCPLDCMAGERIGMYTYESREEATKDWNHRCLK